MKHPNNGGYLLTGWRIFCNDKIIMVKKIFVRTSFTLSPTGDLGAKTLPPIGTSFMYIETSLNNHGNNVFVNSERNDIIQITNITF